ncbi:hypothetical protein [Bacillus mycoides]|uniref:Uncharacterized protein n=1 Tax=Bacillus mycoides (strain KBAB4) TaxID=315730 RepID=A9VVN0_BACMK|nr:hypothetical protein [Bacillus mycoides]ABY46845.1 hypothetical protein BcerKBAB4_5351 [Bacillus mycoides KBAB4]
MEIEISKELTREYGLGDVVEIQWKGEKTPKVYLIIKTPVGNRLCLMGIDGVGYSFLQQSDARIVDLINALRHEADLLESYTLYSKEFWKLKMERKGGGQ